MRKKRQRLLFVLPVLAFLVINPVKAQQYMRINLSDGTAMEIALENIQKLTFDLTTAILQHPEVAKQLLKLKAFPNPVKDQLTIDYTLYESGQVLIEVFNIGGTRLNSISQGFQQSGEYKFHMNTQHLTSATYICRVQQNNKFVIEKIIVIH
jgi:hypothetical protein